MNKDEKARPPLLRATVDVDWPGRGGKTNHLGPSDPPTREVPPKVAAWMLRCGALVDVEAEEAAEAALQEVPDAG